jgi:hypothetical protein
MKNCGKNANNETDSDHNNIQAKNKTNSETDIWISGCPVVTEYEQEVK